jgi:hypothetical protein
MVLGSKCRKSTWRRRAPIASAARTYPSSRSRSTSARTNRLVANQPVAPIRKIRAGRGTCSHTASTSRRIKSRGMARAPSTIRIRPASTRPPQYPETIPTAAPIVAESPTASSATLSDILAPETTRESTSRLSWSVPNGWPGPGGRLPPRMSGCANGSGSIQGPTMAATETTSRRIAPILPRGLRQAAFTDASAEVTPGARAGPVRHTRCQSGHRPQPPVPPPGAMLP